MPDSQPLSDQTTRPDMRSLMARIADELRHNDECGSRELMSEDEYMDDARAILRIVDEHPPEGFRRLRAENERWERRFDAWQSWRTFEIEENGIRAENQRLRETLAAIVDVRSSSNFAELNRALDAGYALIRELAAASDEQEASDA